MEKNTGKVREKSGNFVIPEKWEPCITVDITYCFSLQQYGLVFISNEEEGETGEEKPALVTPEAKEILSKVEGSLGI